MKKYFLAIASFFIYSHISLGQVYPGQMDSTFVPVRSHHYDPELTFDFCVNEPAWSNQAGIHSAFGSTDRLYFPNHPSGMDDGGCAERNRSRHV